MNFITSFYNMLIKSYFFFEDKLVRGDELSQSITSFTCVIIIATQQRVHFGEIWSWRRGYRKLRTKNCRSRIKILFTVYSLLLRNPLLLESVFLLSFIFFSKWTERGCKVKQSDYQKTVCLCNHLTNFAILMRPYSPVRTVILCTGIIK